MGADPACSEPRHAPAQEPPAASRSPRFSQGPMVVSLIRKSHSESFVRQTRGPALGTAPAHGPWGFLHRGTSRRLTPTSAHAHIRAGIGEERGQTQRARNPATLLLKSPQLHRVRPTSVRCPWSAIAVTCCPLAGTLPHHTIHADPQVAPYGMFWLNAPLRKRKPSSPPRFGRGGDVLEASLLPSRSQERYAECPGPRPGSAGARPARRLRTGAAHLRMGWEEESARGIPIQAVIIP